MEARKSVEGLAAHMIPGESGRSRPKSSYAVSAVGSRIQSRASTQVGSQVTKNKVFNKLKARKLNM